MALAVALVLGHVACGSGSDGSDGASAEAGATSSSIDPSSSASTADPSPSTAAPDTSGPPTSAAEPTPTTADSRTEVPIDLDLVERLPQFSSYDGLVSDDPSFDIRLCDGREAPTVPEGQARATYDVGPDENLTVAAYRFQSGVAPYYLSVYSEAVRSCARESGESRDLGLVDAVGFSYGLVTDAGDAFVAMAVRDDVLWVAFQVRVDGRPVEVDPGTVATFISAVEG